MDTNIEDKMYHQIEKNLSNNINENLFSAGKVTDKEKLPMLQSTVIESTDLVNRTKDVKQEYVDESFADMSQQPTLSRAEYIRQAREACLRQLSNQSIRMMDTYYPENEEIGEISSNKKKTKAMKLFKDNERMLSLPWADNKYEEEETPQDIASYQSLIIRLVCAIVLFLGVFLIDKFDFQLGTFSKEVVREYVTGNDTLKQLEEVVVSWLK